MPSWGGHTWIPPIWKGVLHRHSLGKLEGLHEYGAVHQGIPQSSRPATVCYNH